MCAAVSKSMRTLCRRDSRPDPSVRTDPCPTLRLQAVVVITCQLLQAPTDWHAYVASKTITVPGRRSDREW
jgi:hypothetical protein